MFDPLNRSTQYAYDVLNRPIRITGPDPDGEGEKPSPEQFLSYDALGRLITERDEHGNVTRYEYDKSHRVTKIIAPLGATTEYLYDAAGQLLRVTDPLGRTTTYAYDGAGRLSSVLLPGASNPTTYQYDTLGNLRFVTDPLGHTTEYQYDARSRLVQEIDANDAVTVYGYNDANELKTLTDPALNTTTWTYDAAGRVIAETNEFDATRSYKYDTFGRVIQVTDRNERVTTYEYDDLNRLTNERWYVNQADLNSDPNSPLRHLQFDYTTGVDQLDAVSDFGPNGEYGSNFNYQFDYDNLGNVTQTYMNLEGLGLAEKVRSTASSTPGGSRRPRPGWGPTTRVMAAQPTSSTSTTTTHSADSPASNRARAPRPATMRSPRSASTSRTTRTASSQASPASPIFWARRSWPVALRLRRPRPAAEPHPQEELHHLRRLRLHLRRRQPAHRVYQHAHTSENATYTYDDRGQLRTADRSGMGRRGVYVRRNGNRFTSAANIRTVYSANNQLVFDGWSRE